MIHKRTMKNSECVVIGNMRALGACDAVQIRHLLHVISFGNPKLNNYICIMIIKCKNCNTDFDCETRRYNYNIKNKLNIFCSHKCYNEYKKSINNIVSKCANCNKEVIKTKSQAKKSKTGNTYCSRSCSTSFNNTLFKSGENHPNYKTLSTRYRSKELKYYDNKCMDCGNVDIDVLQVHHIDEDRTNNKLDNLCILCANCHLKRHKNGKK